MKNKKIINIDIKNKFIFLPLGGAGEIGMNLNLYHYKNKWLIVDMGLGFTDKNSPGTNISVPNINFIINEIKDNILGIIITHGHEDHIGGLPYLWPKINCPLYATKFTTYLINEKFKNHKLNIQNNIYEIKQNSSIKLGCFNFMMIPITHSIPETSALLISTNYGSVFHTGDWRFDNNPIIGNKTSIDQLKKIGSKNILALIGDSTNIFINKEAKTEKELENNLLLTIKKYTYNLVIITTFASNLSRIQSLFNIAKKLNKKIILIGGSLWKMYNAGKYSGYLKNEIAYKEKRIKQFKRSEIILICTGCQGEKNASLFKIIYNKNIFIKCQQDDVVIFSSKMIPGNEKKIHKLYNILSEKKVTLFNEYNQLVHVSGHPSKEEVKKIYDYICPQIAVPIHGESFHLLEHCKVAKKCGIKHVIQIKNGNLLHLDKNNPKIIKVVHHGKDLLDGKNLIDSNNSIFKARSLMCNNGVIFIFVITSSCKANKIHLSTPGIFTNHKEKDTFFNIKKIINKIVENSKGNNINLIKIEIFKLVKNKINHELKKNPLIEVQIISM